jgi:acetyl-CoA synthetase
MFDISNSPSRCRPPGCTVSQDDYQRLYRQSIEHPDTFWAEQAKRFLDWINPGNRAAMRPENRQGPLVRRRPTERQLQLHRPPPGPARRADGLLWEGDDPKIQAITYRELHQNVCRLANVLKSRGVKKGDRVCIYMPMIPEAAFAMLACTRIGAVHSVVFGGFSPTPCATGSSMPTAAP